MRLLEARGAEVAYHDPHVASFREDGQVHTGVELTAEVLGRADAVVIVTDHRAFTEQWPFVLEHARLVIDTRNATAKAAGRGRARVVGLGDVRLGAPTVPTESPSTAEHLNPPVALATA
jgi:UDP-N-acetyl-D-glucosamine dehydrogenase